MKKIASSRIQRGVILPIVLVVMMVVTTLVLTQVKRGTVDERLAGNWSRVVSGETAAESLLRLCEHTVINVDWKYAKWWYPSTNFTATPAWKVPLPQLDPTKVKIFTDTLPPGATGAYCVIEDATSELGTVKNFTGENEQNQQLGAGKNANLMKHRFTTAVTFADGTAFGGVTYHSQSEIRWTPKQ